MSGPGGWALTSLTSIAAVWPGHAPRCPGPAPGGRVSPAISNWSGISAVSRFMAMSATGPRITTGRLKLAGKGRKRCGQGLKPEDQAAEAGGLLPVQGRQKKEVLFSFHSYLRLLDEWDRPAGN